MFAFWTKRQREISEQAHVALTARMCPRHRVSIRYQPIIIGLTEKIATQQLKSVSGSFDFLLQDRLISFKRTTSIFEMRFVAMIRKNYQGLYERGDKCNQRDSNWFQ